MRSLLFALREEWFLLTVNGAEYSIRGGDVLCAVLVVIDITLKCIR